MTKTTAEINAALLRLANQHAAGFDQEIADESDLPPYEDDPEVKAYLKRYKTRNQYDGQSS